LGGEPVILADAGHYVAGLGFIMGDRFLVSASADRHFRIWDLDAKRQLRGIAKHNEGGQPLTVSPTGQQVLSNGAYGQFLLWDFSRTRESSNG